MDEYEENPTYVPDLGNYWDWAPELEAYDDAGIPAPGDVNAPAPATPGYYDEITGEFIPTDGPGVVPGPLDDTSGTKELEGWKYQDGVWTDPAGKTYDLSYLNVKDKSALSRFISYAKKMFGGEGSTEDYMQLLPLLGGLFGANQSSNSSILNPGYQGGIPRVTATRTMLTEPPAGRRPGSGGINYGGDVTYARTGENLSAENAGISTPVSQPLGGTPTHTQPAAYDLASLASMLQQAQQFQSQNRPPAPAPTPAGIPAAPTSIAPAGQPAGLPAAPQPARPLTPLEQKMQKDYEAYFASTKPGSYTDFAGGVLYRADPNRAIFITPDREYTLRSGSQLSDIAATIPEIAKQWEQQYGYKTTAPATLVPVGTSSPGYNPILAAYTDADRPWSSTRKAIALDPQLRSVDLSGYTNNPHGAWEELARQVYGDKGMTMADIGRLERATGAVGMYRTGEGGRYYLDPRSPFSKNVVPQGGYTYDQLVQLQQGVGQNQQPMHTPQPGQVIPGAAKGGLMPDGFVIPADVVSHLGNGSSEAGLELLAEELGAKPIKGEGDGMSDSIPTTIGGKQPARVANEEAFVPPEVVKRLGNGDTERGAKKLYAMMDRIRKARTGTTEQGKQINPEKFMPGGKVARYQTGGTTTPTSGGSSLAEWVGPYAADMLGKGQALSEMPYTAYTGPLTAGASPLQQQAFGTAAGLQTPAQFGQAAGIAGAAGQRALDVGYTPVGQSITGGPLSQPISGAPTSAVPSMTGTQPVSNIAQAYMNPYLESVLNPQLRELTRQADITRAADAARMAKAGAFGGSRQAIMESEGRRNLMQQQSDVLGQGYATAYDKALAQFNAEQARKIAEAQFGTTTGLEGIRAGLQGAQTLGTLGSQQQQSTLDNLRAMAEMGATQRGIEAEGIAADKAQFEEARLNPYKMLQFQQSLLTGLPLAAQSMYMPGQSNLQQFAGGFTTIAQLLQSLGLLSK